jgi:hypothetical protein
LSRENKFTKFVEKYTDNIVINITILILLLILISQSATSMDMRIDEGGSITGQHSNFSQRYSTQTNFELHLTSSPRRAGSEEARAFPPLSNAKVRNTWSHFSTHHTSLGCAS